MEMLLKKEQNKDSHIITQYNGLSKVWRSAASLLIGASLIGLTSLGGLDYAVGKAYAEVQRVKVSGDLKIKTDKSENLIVYGARNKKANEIEEEERRGKAEEEVKREHLYNLVQEIKTFEYNGQTYNFKSAENKKIIRGNKVVFSANFNKEGEYKIYNMPRGTEHINIELFSADVSNDGKLTNIKKLTDTIDKNEVSPIWANDGNILYVEARLTSKGSSKDDTLLCFYALADPNGKFLRYVSEAEANIFKRDN